MLAQGHSLAEQNTVSGGTALHSACASGAIQLIQLLLKHGVSVDSEDKYPPIIFI